MAPDQIDQAVDVKDTGKWPTSPALSGHFGHEEGAWDWGMGLWALPRRQQPAEVFLIQSVLELAVEEINGLPSG
jgi:hypothetical protein